MKAKDLYKIFTNCTPLCALLKSGRRGIYKDYSPAAGSYPALVFHVTTRTPDGFADDEPHKILNTLRVSIITADGEDWNIEQITRNLLEKNGARWQRVNRLRDAGEFYTTLDFVFYEDYE